MKNIKIEVNKDSLTITVGLNDQLDHAASEVVNEGMVTVKDPLENSGIEIADLLEFKSFTRLSYGYNPICYSFCKVFFRLFCNR